MEMKLLSWKESFAERIIMEYFAETRTIEIYSQKYVELCNYKKIISEGSIYIHVYGLLQSQTVI